MKNPSTTISGHKSSIMDIGKKVFISASLITAGILLTKINDVINTTNQNFGMRIEEWKDKKIPIILKQPLHGTTKLTSGPTLVDTNRITFTLSSGGTNHQFICDNIGETCEIVTTTITNVVGILGD